MNEFLRLEHCLPEMGMEMLLTVHEVAGRSVYTGPCGLATARQVTVCKYDAVSLDGVPLAFSSTLTATAVHASAFALLAFPCPQHRLYETCLSERCLCAERRWTRTENSMVEVSLVQASTPSDEVASSHCLAPTTHSSSKVQRRQDEAERYQRVHCDRSRDHIQVDLLASPTRGETGLSDVERGLP